jgi:aryl carrier-like protein
VYAVRRDDDTAPPNPSNSSDPSSEAGAPHPLLPVPPPHPRERLRQALEDFLGDDGPPVDLEVRHGAPPAPPTASGTGTAVPAAAPAARNTDPATLAVVTTVWTDLLTRPPGPQDDFFAAGGTSLTAVRLLARLRERLGGTLGLADLLEEPTPAGLVHRLLTSPRPTRRTTES